MQRPPPLEVLEDGRRDVELVRIDGEDALAHEAQHPEALRAQVPPPPPLQAHDGARAQQPLRKARPQPAARGDRAPDALQRDGGEDDVEGGGGERDEQLGDDLGRLLVAVAQPHRLEQLPVAPLRGLEDRRKVLRRRQHQPHELAARVDLLHDRIVLAAVGPDGERRARRASPPWSRARTAAAATACTPPASGRTRSCGGGLRARCRAMRPTRGGSEKPASGGSDEWRIV